MNVRRILLWFRKLHQRISTIPKWIFIVAASLLAGGIYIFFCIIPITINFSYTDKVSCVDSLTFFPNVYNTVDKSNFDIYTDSDLKIGNLSILSRKICVKPLSAPSEGTYDMTLSPFGGFIATKRFNIIVPTDIKFNTQTLRKPLSVSKPITLEATEQDLIFDYKIAVNNQTASCLFRNKSLECDPASLGLSQGAKYDYKLEKYFNTKKISTIVSSQLETLTAITIVGSSVQSDERIFSKPQELVIKTDKQLKVAEGYLARIGESSEEKMAAAIKVEGQDVKVTLVDHLPRMAKFKLTVSSVEAVDGSGLSQPFDLVFETSGGPKVSAISVPKQAIPIGTTAIVEFDQALSETQDITKAISLGGGARVIKFQGNRLWVALDKVGKCGDFTISINDGLKSNFDIDGGTAWSFTGRMACYGLETIGYSQKGRAINAYSFGNGPRAVVFTGAIHGNEMSTKYLMDRLIKELEINARSIPADKSVIVIPQINPDGAAAGTRTNARNIDLNRNFPTSDWQKDITTVNNQPFPGGGGETPLSEPETRVLANYIQRVYPILVMSYHSIGGLLTANQVGISNTLAVSYSALSGYRNATGQSDTTFEYAISGTADDWYGEKLGIPSLVIELGSHSSPQFERNQKAMWAMINNS